MITVKVNAPGVKPIAGELVVVAAVKKVHGANRTEILHAGDQYDREELLDAHATLVAEGLVQFIRMTLAEQPGLSIDEITDIFMLHVRGVVQNRVDELK